MYNNKIYVFGGREHNTFKSDLWEYDITTDAWKMLSTGPSARYGHDAAVSYERLYVFGGDDGSYRNDLWEYDPQTDTWKQLPPATLGRVHSGLAEVQSKLYFFGGYVSSSTRLNDLWQIT